MVSPLGWRGRTGRMAMGMPMGMAMGINLGFEVEVGNGVFGTEGKYHDINIQYISPLREIKGRLSTIESNRLDSAIGRIQQGMIGNMIGRKGLRAYIHTYIGREEFIVLNIGRV